MITKTGTFSPPPRIRHGGALAAVLFCLAFAALCSAMEWRDHTECGEVFRREGITGAFVLHDPVAERFTGYNRERAATRLCPASTFKIPHTLIGLAAGAVPDVDWPLPHPAAPSGPAAPCPAMSLREAIAVSHVPAYQELARRIGLPAMRRALRELNYGNADPGETVDRFWLDGPLAVSAMEQAVFLSRLAMDALPFPRDAMAAVRDIIRIEKGPAGELFGKTGATADLGWWVGWVRHEDGRVRAFALTLDIAGEADYSKRIELGRRCLSVMGVWRD